MTANSEKFPLVTSWLSTNDNTKNDAIALIRNEIRPQSISHLDFMWNWNSNDMFVQFTHAVRNILTGTQNGLYIHLKLENNILLTTKYSADDIMTLLAKLYQICDNLTQKTHGMTFDARIIIDGIADFFNINEVIADSTFLNKYSEVVVGGTYDHLHSGHKILITVATLMSSSKFNIGLVNDEILQKKKKFAFSLQSFQERKQCLLNFIACIKNNAIDVNKYMNIEPLSDIYGPSLLESNEALIASMETMENASKVNIKRIEMGFKPMDIISIHLIQNKSIYNENNNNNSANGSGNEEIKETEAEEISNASNVIANKVSSTDIREWCLKHEWLHMQFKRLVEQLLAKFVNQSLNKQKVSCFEYRFCFYVCYILKV